MLRICGTGFPEWIRLRRYQYPPPARAAPAVTAAVLHGCARRVEASQKSPAVRAIAGGRKLTFVPAARPAPSAQMETTPSPGLVERPSRVLAVTVTRIATAARRKKAPARSLRASPAWSARTPVFTISATAAIETGAAENGRPIAQAAARHPPSQTRLISGGRMSLP